MLLEEVLQSLDMAWCTLPRCIDSDSFIVLDLVVARHSELHVLQTSNQYKSDSI